MIVVGRGELSPERKVPDMIITAKFSSVCPCCSVRIVAGTEVEWSKGEKARHVACRSSPRRGSYGWDGVVGSSSYYTSGQYDEES